MRLLINMTNRIGGGSRQVGFSIISESRNFPNNEYIVVLNSKIDSMIDKSKYGNNYTFVIVNYNNYLQLSPLMKKVEKKYKPDVVFTIFGPSYWKPNVPHLMGFATPHYIYPNNPFWKVCSCKDKINYFFKKQINIYCFRKEADAVVCETLDTTERFQKLIKKSNIKYYTVSNTCSNYYRNDDWKKNSPKLPSRRAEEFRFIYITKYYTHKNIEIIPKILANLEHRGIDNITFVLTIDEKNYKHSIPEKFRKNVYCTGPVPVDECPALYNECDAAFMPSFLECFSANYPEAMAMRKPIIASDFGFSRTVCGDAALYFDATNSDQATDLIINLSTNKSIYSKLQILGANQLSKFDTPESRIKKDLEICKSLIEAYN